MTYDLTPGRMRGRKLQQRRVRVWARNPYCSMCHQLTEFECFHLDHILALANGGKDTEDNCQVLCLPCHDRKTARDLHYTERVAIGPDGWPL